jgi:hypothetical protein
MNEEIIPDFEEIAAGYELALRTTILQLAKQKKLNEIQVELIDTLQAKIHQLDCDLAEIKNKKE